MHSVSRLPFCGQAHSVGKNEYLGLSPSPSESYKLTEKLLQENKKRIVFHSRGSTKEVAWKVESGMQEKKEVEIRKGAP